MYITNIIKQKKGFRVFLFVLFILMCFNPYMIMLVHFPQMHIFGGSLLQLVYVLLLFLILISKRGKIVVFQGSLQTCVIIQLVGLGFSFIYHGAIGYLLVGITMALVLLLISYLEKTITLKEFFSYYNKWILWMSIGGVVVFILALIGIPPLFEYMNPVSEIDNISSWLVGFTNTYNIANTGITSNFVRYSGYFDEPGAMGYWGIYALIFNKLFIGNQKLEKILLVLLLFTFSMGYFIQVFVYLILFYALKSSKFRFSFLIVIGLVMYGIYSTKGTDYSELYKVSFARLESLTASSTSDIYVEDKRGEVMKQARKVFRENPVMGVGAVKWSKMPYMADNPYETLAKDGILGTVYYYMPYFILVYMSLKRKDREMQNALFVLFLGFMHRPFHGTLLAFFITYSLLYLYEKKHFKSKAVSNCRHSGV